MLESTNLQLGFVFVHCEHIYEKPHQAVVPAHDSLRGANTLVGERSVFTRVERIQKLIHDGKLSEDDSPHGLPKVRTHFKVKTKKKVEADATTTPEGEGEAGTEAQGDDSSES